MTAKTEKPQPVVTLSIQPGTVAPAARNSWRRWWAGRLLAAARVAQAQGASNEAGTQESKQ